jgi:hypothetical protein
MRSESTIGLLSFVRRNQRRSQAGGHRWKQGTIWTRPGSQIVDLWSWADVVDDEPSNYEPKDVLIGTPPSTNLSLQCCAPETTEAPAFEILLISC